MKKISLNRLNEEIENNKNLFIFFNADWCGQCKMSSLMLDDLFKKFGNINFISINVDDNNLWDDKKFNLKKIPTFIGYKNNELIFNEQGYKKKTYLLELLDKIK